MRYEVFMPITPPTATDQHMGHRVGFVNGRHIVLSYRKKPQKKVHELYSLLLKQDIMKRDDGIGSLKMFCGPVKVEIDFQFPHSVNTAKRDRNKWFARTTRPDLDNMAKGLLDCITDAGLLQDDAQICCLKLRKFNCPASHQGARITITDELDCTVDGGKVKEGNN